MDGTFSGDFAQHKSAVSIRLIQDTKPDSLYFLKNLVKTISQTIRDAYNSIIATFSLDNLTYYDFRKLISPLITSGVAYIVGESVTQQMSQYVCNNDEYDFIFKLMIGTAILTYSASHRITEEKIESATDYRQAAVSEILAIVYLYTSVYQCSQKLLSSHFVNDNYPMIASLATSTMVVPCLFSYLVKQYQNYSTQNLYEAGAQLSTKATISCGQTPFANTYFQLNYYLLPEIASFSRMFQLGLITDNILHAKSMLQKFRNGPAFLLDVFPPIIKKIVAQKKVKELDYNHNTSKQTVLNLKTHTMEDVLRYQLRTGDLVALFSDEMDLNLSPLSGEIYALEQDEQGRFTSRLMEQEYSINLASKNGEANWIKLRTQSEWSNEFKQVGLKEIHDRIQPGVLTGTKLNLHGKANFFVRIKEEKDRLPVNNEEKKAVINQIIAEHKRNTVMFAIASSILTGYLISDNLSTMPIMTLRLLFNVAQMMIAFSENVLREMVNSRLMKEINERLPSCPLENIDAMRVVDLCNALGGYYRKKFPQDIVLVTDKTGTLTTPKMDVKGIWTGSDSLMPSADKFNSCFELFAAAYTNSSKGEEPEEFSMFQLFKNYFSDDCLHIEIISDNHFKKYLLTTVINKTIETMHLGLCRSLGGRLTLVEDDNKKYLIFCGIPRSEYLANTPLFKAYTAMPVRTGVLSRDWCVARAHLSDELFTEIKKLFLKNNHPELEKFILSNSDMLSELVHFGTFIIDNSLKKDADKLVSRCKKLKIPVIMATGDNPRAAKNMADVLAPDSSANIVIIRSAEELDQLEARYSSDSTIIFVGINDSIVNAFDLLMKINMQDRPVIIFSEMSPVGKGLLVSHLRRQKYFVIANGDGTNDVKMLENANVGLTHLTEEGTFAKDVAECSDLNEKQLQMIFQSDKSFYELFDIHEKHSKFLELFAPLANTQEKPSMALLLKSFKISFEVAVAMGLPLVTEMKNQFLYSVCIDTLWLLFSYYAITKTSELPMDRMNLTESYMPIVCMIGSIFIASVSACYNYFQYSESTNLPTMFIFLSLFSVVLESLFNRYGAQRDLARAEVIEEKMPGKMDHLQSQAGMFGSCRRKREEPVTASDMVIYAKQRSISQ